jgi:hypothetical protein
MNKEIVRDLFEYREDNLWWRERPANRVDMSKPAGSVKARGHREIMFKGKLYKAHRLIFLYVYGRLPDNDIDHINGKPLDNRIENLRDVTQQENNKNKRKQSNNTSGHVGVYWHKRTEKWVARIWVDGVQKNLGRFNVLEDAVAARQAASIKHGFHDNHGRD